MHAAEAIQEYEDAQRRADDLGVHTLFCKKSGVSGEVSTLDVRVVGDWSV